MKILRGGASALITLWMCAQATLSSAAEGTFYGPLRSRDLTPFGFLRLDMRPAHAVSIEPGTWAFETELGYQNTWALSEEVEKYLIELEKTGRRNIGPAEVAAIEQLPGENYLLDLELATIDLNVHYKISDEWAAHVIVSAVSYQGGFLDDTIEQFHDAFGFSTFGRPAVSRNDVNLIYDLKSAHVVSLGSPTGGGLADPIFGLRFTGWSLPQPWQLSLEGAVKVPVSGRRLLLSTGRTDSGVQASFQRHGIRNAFYLNAAAVYYSGTLEPAPQRSQIIPTVILGYEFKLTARTNINIQVYGSKSVYSRVETDLDELRGTKYQYTLGLRHRFDDFLFSFGFTENVQNVNNTPDIGIQLGFAYIPHFTRGR